MDDSPLKRLPGEIRNNIYELVLIHSADKAVQICSKETKHGRSIFVEEADGLLMTCKQIRAESLPIFLSKNLFDIRLDFTPRQDTSQNRDIEENCTALAPFNQFIDFLGETKLTKLAIYINLGAFNLEHVSEFFVLKDLLKSLASKRATKGACLALFVMRYPASDSITPLHEALLVNCWSLRESIPSASEALCKAVKEKGRHPDLGERAKQMLDAWTRADWTY